MKHPDIDLLVLSRLSGEASESERKELSLLRKSDPEVEERYQSLKSDYLTVAREFQHYRGERQGREQDAVDRIEQEVLAVLAEAPPEPIEEEPANVVSFSPYAGKSASGMTGRSATGISVFACTVPVVSA